MTLDAFRMPGTFYRGNLHTHSNRSDGRLEPEEVCRRYRERGYDFLCLSDHFMAKYGFPVTDTRPWRTNSFTTLLGAEVHAPAIQNGEPWHILAVGLPEDFAPTASDEMGPALARRAAAAGAFVAIAHPEWYGLTLEDTRTLDDVPHAVEVYNHTSEVHEDRADGAYLLDALLSEGRRLTAIAVDDAHFKLADTPDSDAFGGWVMVKATANEPEALLAALKAGHFYATQGPEFRDLSIEGGALHVTCTPVQRVIAVGRPPKSERVAGAALTRATLPLEKFKGSWVRIVLTDAAGKRAWSNPIHLG